MTFRVSWYLLGFVGPEQLTIWPQILNTTFRAGQQSMEKLESLVKESVWALRWDRLGGLDGSPDKNGLWK
jgi:hypothetical protein